VSRPGHPSLLRAINDRAALEALLDRGPLTRTEIGAHTGLSKPTASQLLSRLRDAGLVVADGIRAGAPGRTAELYRINPAAGYAAGLDVTAARLVARITDLTGEVVGEARLDTPGRQADSAVRRVREALRRAAAPADLDPSRVRHVVVGAPGAINPATGRLGYAAHLPGWHEAHILDRLADDLGVPVDFENDVNLVAIAEAATGAAAGSPNFALLWAAEGVGMAVVLGGALHRGATGGAGEVGYMPVAGAPVVRDVSRANTGGLQKQIGGTAVRRLLREHGFGGRSAPDALARTAAARGDARADAALGELATRMATGLAAITSVLDPELIVLHGHVPLAGGEPLRHRVEAELYSMTIPRPRLRLGTVGGSPVLAGALELSLAAVRDSVFDDTVRS
jgi:predicted NBD/HSP70 family sugar kinase